MQQLQAVLKQKNAELQTQAAQKKCDDTQESIYR